MSILLKESFETPFGATPFNEIQVSDYLPSLKEAIKLSEKEIEAITSNSDEPSFANTIEALESSGKFIGRISTVFYNMFSSNSSEELVAAAKEFSPLVTAHHNENAMNEKLFTRIKSVFNQKDSLGLTAEQETLLNKMYKSFTRNGALLNDEDKEKLKAIDNKLSTLGIQFGDNVLKETNEYKLVIENEGDLAGLPESAIEAAAETAKEKDLAGKWVFTLSYPSVIPFLRYADKRELREELYKALGAKANKGDDLDNKKILKEIATLRHERANLLGYKTHADYVLEERMAMNPETVFNFLDDISKHALPVGQKEIAELKEYAKSLGGPEDLKNWDYAYYAEKLKKEKFDVNDEDLKPYFKLENVVAGAFEVAKKLYGLSFKQRDDIPKYHEDVTVYEVTNETGDFVSLFYTDFFPRESKRMGAWMTEYRSQSENERPHISIVCNFSKPTETKPSLLTFDSVQTLFHEFGHALHGMLANTKYAYLSGTSVYWDFVELPSQVLENWTFEKECLDLFAEHYETKEKIPADLVQKIVDSSNFHEGRNTLRQLGLGYLDMAWHSADPSKVEDVEKFEEDAMASTDLFAKVPGYSTSCSFSHIFQGGYSSGYYSYKWAEVLDADAFDYFKENGIFNKEIADKFKENILSKGGTEHPMTLYKRFRGKEPSVEPLLKRAGLIK